MNQAPSENRWEKYYPIFLTVVITLLFWCLLSAEKVNISNFEKLIDMSVNLSGILLGFLITLQGILISIRGSKIMRVLQQAGILFFLNRYLKWAVISTAMLLIFCVCVLVFDFDSVLALGGQNPRDVLILAWMMLLTFMGLNSYRFISTFITIISEEARE